MSRGIDIYRYQTVTDPQAVKRSGVAFSWVKLTDGNGPAMVKGDRQVAQMKAAGIPVGGYHFSQPGDPVRQANELLGEVRRLRAAGLPPALDLEDNPPGSGKPNIPHGQKRDWAIRFCRRVQAAGFRPCVYMSASDAGSLRPDRWGISGLVIWIAAYGTNNGRPYSSRTDPAKVRRYYGGRYDVHQFTSTARVPGISGDVDVNESLTSLGTVVPPSEEDELDATEKRMLRELHANLRKGNPAPGVKQSAGELTLMLREILLTSRTTAGKLSGLQNAYEQLAKTGKVDMTAVTKAAEQGATVGAEKAIEEALAELEAGTDAEVQA